MKTVDIQGSVRSETGTKVAKQLRRDGLVPCELYGAENVHFQLKEMEIRKLVYTPDVYKVTLELDGKKYDSVIKEVQFHPVNDAVLHADFLQLQDGKPAIVAIPVRLEGAAIGVMNGGKLKHVLRKLKLKALAQDFPDVVTVDISKLRIGQQIRVKDVTIPGVEILEPANAVIVGIKTARGAVDEEEEEEEGAAEGAEAPAEEAAAEA